MRIVPLLLRPTLLAAKNRCSAGGYRSVKEMLGIVVSLGMIVGMYISTKAALEGSADLIRSGALDPFAPLSLLLTSLFIMLTLSASIAGIGALFLSKDLDLLLSSPLSLNRFLFGRCCDVAVSTGWMVCVFGLPSLVAFGRFFKCETSFFIAAPILCLFCIGLAAVFGMLGALMFGAIVSPKRGRSVLLALFLVSLLLFFGSINSASVSQKLTITSIASQAELMNSAAHALSPGYFWAHAILDLKQGSFYLAAVTVAATCLLILGAWLCMKAIAAQTYARAYACLRNEGDSLKLNSRASQRLARILFPFLRSDRRALVTKEYKIFARDLTHTIQLSMLLAICFIYLYNFRALEAPLNAPEEVQTLWQLLLLVVNVALSFLVLTCICSRFVFPSMSLEGSSFWILQSAPVSMRNILRAKVLSWFMPISVIGAIMFMSGAMAIGAHESLVLSTGIVGIILTYGLVGLGVGLGALFAHFEWDYASQVSSNVGSFLFMALSILFLIANLIPVTLMFGAYSLMPDLFHHHLSSTVILALGILTLAVFNYLCVAAALSVGSRALKVR